mmetsp:Transcript_161359/g.512714  ORF Transcript_161359/g.512714 Transcript_161359/m.512714 type:complete len:800 (+) Transcript_161359:57-2456(+)
MLSYSPGGLRTVSMSAGGGGDSGNLGSIADAGSDPFGRPSSTGHGRPPADTQPVGGPAAAGGSPGGAWAAGGQRVGAAEGPDRSNGTDELSEDAEDEGEECSGRTEPATVRRKCTDVGWLVPLVLCTGLMVVITVVGIPNSDPNRLGHYMDYAMNLCGTGPNLNKTNLFFCMKEGSEENINSEYPLCRENCPNGSDTNYTCKRQGINPTTNKTELVNYSVPDYETFSVSGGLECAPLSSKKHKLWHEHRHRHGRAIVENVILYDRMIRFAWEPLALAGVFALFASYAYLLMVGYFARTLVLIGIILLSVAPVCFGSTLVWCLRGGPEFTCDLTLHNEDYSVGEVVMAKYSGTWDPAKIESVDPNGMYTILATDVNTTEEMRRNHLKCADTDTATDDRLLVAMACILVGSIFSVFFCTQAHKVDSAISCLEWAFQLIFTTPSLLLHPIMTIALRLVLAIWMYSLGRCIMSVFVLDIITPKTASSGADVAIATFFVFLLWWLMHWCAAVSLFVVMYTTQVWYFSGGLKQDVDRADLPVMLALKAVGVCCRYHLGSMALGSLVCGVAFPFRWVLEYMTGMARLDGNPVGRVIGACCSCCVSLYEGVFGPLSTNAYLEVVRSSRPFMEAAGRSYDMLDDDSTVDLLSGVTLLFQALGVGIVGTLSFMMTHLVVQIGLPGKNFNEKGAPWYVVNVSVEAFAGTCIAVFVAVPVMMLFGIVSDTVLYCHTVDELWHNEEEPLVDGTWTDGVRSYVSELMGCSCGWRPNKLGAAAGQPPPMMPADEGSSPENRDRASPARGGRTRT